MPTADQPATLRRDDDVSALVAKPKTRRGGKPRFDRGAAFAFFASDPLTTFVDVAREFGVSDTAIRKHARNERWIERRDEILAKANASLIEDGILKPLAERNRETLLLIRKGLRQVDTNGDTPKWSDVPGLVKLEQLLEGEATDRVEKREVVEIVQVVLTVASEFVPKELRPAFLSRFDEVMGTLPALTVGDTEPSS